MRAYQIVSDGGIDALALNDCAVPKAGPCEVLVKINASSINYRDLSTIENPVPRGVPYPTIPNSDGAGDVVEVGEDVTKFKTGDRVCGIFFQQWIDGELTESDTPNICSAAPPRACWRSTESCPRAGWWRHRHIYPMRKRLPYLAQP